MSLTQQTRIWWVYNTHNSVDMHRFQDGLASDMQIDNDTLHAYLNGGARPLVASICAQLCAPPWLRHWVWSHDHRVENKCKWWCFQQLVTLMHAQWYIRTYKTNCFLLEWTLKVSKLWHLSWAILMKLDEKGTEQLFQEWFTLGTSGKIAGVPALFWETSKRKHKIMNIRNCLIPFHLVWGNIACFSAATS